MTTTPDRMITLDAASGSCPINSALATVVEHAHRDPNAPQMHQAQAFLDALIVGEHPARADLDVLAAELILLRVTHDTQEDMRVLMEAADAVTATHDRARRAPQVALETEQSRATRLGLIQDLTFNIARLVAWAPITFEVIRSTQDMQGFRDVNDISADWGPNGTQIAARVTSGRLTNVSSTPDRHEQHVIYYAARIDPDTGREVLVAPIASVNLATLSALACGYTGTLR